MRHTESAILVYATPIAYSVFCGSLANYLMMGDPLYFCARSIFERRNYRISIGGCALGAAAQRQLPRFSPTDFSSNVADFSGVHFAERRSLRRYHPEARLARALHFGIVWSFTGFSDSQCLSPVNPRCTSATSSMRSRWLLLLGLEFCISSRAGGGGRVPFVFAFRAFGF